MTHAEWQFGDSRVAWPLLKQDVYLLVHLHNLFEVVLSLIPAISSRGFLFFSFLHAIAFLSTLAHKNTSAAVQDADESEGKKNSKNK